MFEVFGLKNIKINHLKFVWLYSSSHKVCYGYYDWMKMIWYKHIYTINQWKYVGFNKFLKLNVHHVNYGMKYIIIFFNECHFKLTTLNMLFNLKCYASIKR